MCTAQLLVAEIGALRCQRCFVLRDPRSVVDTTEQAMAHIKPGKTPQLG